MFVSVNVVCCLFNCCFSGEFFNIPAGSELIFNKTVSGLFADCDPYRYADQISVLELYARTFVSVIDYYLDTLC